MCDRHVDKCVKDRWTNVGKTQLQICVRQVDICVKDSWTNG